MTRIWQGGVILLLIIAAAAVYWFWGDIVRAPTNSDTGQGASSLMLAADAYPLYPSVAWGSVASATLEDLTGVELMSQPVTDITDIALVSGPFERYYQMKLFGAGWTVDNSRAASGAGSDITVYQKGSNFIATTFTTDFKGTKPGEPVECPCDVTLGIFSGTAQ
ncbi:MAG TPA: hypothetical protein VG753_01775 [Candidatus Paceibacterota bacterium]|nr:hypothetical protein [Candidatus Paceibacterota bacterium]